MKINNIEIKLKPCPFCGTKEDRLELGFPLIEVVENYGNNYQVACLKCYANGGIETTPQLAAKIWNKRIK